MKAPTKKQIAANQVRSLRAICKKIEAMAKQWEDVDEYNINRLSELSNACEDTAVELIEVEFES